MDKLKFRAVIKRRDGDFDIHYFDFTDFIAPLFSMSQIVMPWLAQGNQPDLFIGFADIHDNPIYEGDIIIVHGGGNFTFQFVGLVEYKRESFSLKCIESFIGAYVNSYYLFPPDDNNKFIYGEIIGNKYQNPDLLQIKEQI